MNLLGLHHLTAITDSAERNYHFMTQVLGMRLVKKTVNQDDIHTYHTFFADDVAAPGTDVTFFDFPNVPAGRSGNNEISRIGLRVPNDEAIHYYRQRLLDHEVEVGELEDFHGALSLTFQESDGQDYRLLSDQQNQGIPAGTPWKNGPVPEEYAIYGLGTMEITVAYFQQFKRLLQEIYDFKVVEETADWALLEVGEGGHGGQIHLIHDKDSEMGIQGYGEVHHVAFRVADRQAILDWVDRYQKLGIRHSGHVDRFYFEAVYARIGHILIELSTDGPGFMVDEPYESLGESLSLPPFIEDQREQIEAAIRPFDTVWKGDASDD
ncbi:ring-cleaving dioxygenase [Hutsoniella sourekii]